MTTAVGRKTRTVVILAGLAALPAVIFYCLLFRHLLDLPFYDDFDALLDFVNGLTRVHGLSARIAYFLATQHNEYKLYFANAVVWLQYSLIGHAEFKSLSVIGDLSVVLLALLLWQMFRPSSIDPLNRLALFLPVPYLLFQMRYFETLNWPMAGLQNLYVLVFALGSIHFLVKTSRWSFVAALILFVLAIAASGNGFVLIPVSLLALAHDRRWVQALIWIITSCCCIAVYSYRYSAVSSLDPHTSTIQRLAHYNPIYVLCFLGSFVKVIGVSFVLGAMLCIFAIWMIWRGYVRKNPEVSYCALFLFLTAFGVAGLRSELGLTQSVSSRYSMYSILLVIFAWFAVVEDFLPLHAPLRKNKVYLVVVAIAVCACAGLDVIGFSKLKSRQELMIQGMRAYEHPELPGSASAPGVPLQQETEEHLHFVVHARRALEESNRLGTYHPPML